MSYHIPFLHCPWYEDKKGLYHGSIYCRSCGAIYDTVGSLIGPIKLLFGGILPTIIGRTDFETMVKITRIGNESAPDLRLVHPIILEAMAEDGRLDALEDSEDGITKEELEKYLNDDNSIVRREAEIALRKY